MHSTGRAMTKNYSTEMKEAGKIKHSRIINMTTLIVGIFGTLIVGIIINQDQKVLDYPKIPLIIILASFAMLYTFIQISELNHLEEIFGWDASLDESKMNRFAKWVANKFTEDQNKKKETN